MEINSQINTFEAGMNLDSDIRMVPNNAYRWAQNVRILTDDAGTSGILQNIEEVRQYLGGLDINEKIVGTAVTNWYNKEKGIVEECGIVVTYELFEGNYINNVWVVTDFNSISPTWTLIVSAEMRLSEKIAIVTNYESTKVSKLYLSDGQSTIKCINIQTKFNTTKATPIKDVTYFDILPSTTIAPFKFVEYCSGNLPAGMVQYCYQLFSTHGSETTTSALSAMIPMITKDGVNSVFVNGDAKDSYTNKGCVLKASLLNDGRHNRIRIIRIQYTVNNQIPRIFILNEADLTSSDSVITFTYNDNGSNIANEISIEEFNDLVPFEFNAKSIVKMDNRVFASNIQELTWDVSYDARAYRCNKNGTVQLNSSIANKSITATLNEILSSETDLIIDMDHDCINPMNTELIYPNDPTKEYAYGYDNANTIRGGKGFNISYRFVTADLVESSLTPTIAPNGQKVIPYRMDLHSIAQFDGSVKLKCPETGQVIHTMDNSASAFSVKNYANPYYVANLLGYQRDETYRFGIVFYNEKNIPSPVHWIGDIRFPSADIVGYEPFTFGGTVNGQGNYELVSHPLGILFSVTNVPSEVKAYEIVRCDRTQADRTVVTQGLLNRTIDFHGWQSPTPNILDMPYEYQMSVGRTDRRPCIMPSFARTVYAMYAQGHYDTNTNKPVQQETQEVNPYDTYGIFDLISPEICFNKESSDNIISSNMKIVPLYCSHSVTYCADNNNKQYRLGIPFTKVLNDNKDYIENPFGCVVKNSDGLNLVSGVFDGFEDKWDRLSGGVCKYYQFFSKSYANKNNNNTRVAFAIKDATKTTNISPFVEDNATFKRYVDYVDGYSYINCGIGSDVAFGPHGVNMAISSPDVYSGGYTGIANTPLGEDYIYNAALFVNIKRETTQYGGNTAMSRSTSIYHSTNTYIKPSWTGYNSAACFGGDTYLGVLDYTNTLLYTKNNFDDLIGNKRYVQVYIPVESSVNLYYRNDEHFAQDVNSTFENNGSTGTANVYYMTEPGSLNNQYTQKTPMYVYNSAYSCDSSAKSYIPKSIYAEDNMQSINRITCSEIKTNNEQIDSWTKFKFANYLDVDSAYGQITNLKVFKNKLYFFQASAVGIASVNDRSLIQDNNVGALTLGTGGILTRFDYLITLNGDSIVNDKSIVNSETTLYWYDFDKNVLCALNNGFNELSKVKQVQTYLNRLPVSARTNPVSFYDKKYNEVWFRIYDRSLIFNEQLNVFTSFYTHNPNWFFPFSTRLVTIKDNNCYYLHNMYNVDDSKDKEARVSYVRFVVNKDIAQTKVFDNQWFSAEFVDAGDEAKPTLITDIHFETKTQETEPIDWESIECREDNYRFAISREKQTSPQFQEQTNMSYAGRMRGKYLICNYTFDCNDNKEFKLPYVKTTYRYSML